MTRRRRNTRLVCASAFVLLLTSACSDDGSSDTADIELEDIESADAASDDDSGDNEADEEPDARDPEEDDALAEFALQAEAVLPPEQAECVVEAIDEEFEVEELDDASEDDVHTMMAIMLECSGAGAGSTDCFVDALVDISGIEVDEFDAAAMVEAVGQQTPESRVELTQAGLICQGAPPEVAECVTDMMIDRFGEEVFESDALVLTDEQRTQLDDIQMDCITNA